MTSPSQLRPDITVVVDWVLKTKSIPSFPISIHFSKMRMQAPPTPPKNNKKNNNKCHYHYSWMIWGQTSHDNKMTMKKKNQNMSLSLTPLNQFWPAIGVVLDGLGIDLAAAHVLDGQGQTLPVLDLLIPHGLDVGLLDLWVLGPDDLATGVHWHGWLLSPQLLWQTESCNQFGNSVQRSNGDMKKIKLK